MQLRSHLNVYVKVKNYRRSGLMSAMCGSHVRSMRSFLHRKFLPDWMGYTLVCLISAEYCVVGAGMSRGVLEPGGTASS